MDAKPSIVGQPAERERGLSAAQEVEIQWTAPEVRQRDRDNVGETTPRNANPRTEDVRSAIHKFDGTPSTPEATNKPTWISGAGLIFFCAFGSLVGGGSYGYAANALVSTPCDASCDSDDTTFKKPWFAALCIQVFQAVGNLSFLGLIKCWHSIRAPPQPVAQQNLPLQSMSELRVDDRKVISVLHADMRTPVLYCALLDVSVCFTQSLAALYIPASIYGAMRGSLLLATALLSRALGVFDGKAGKDEWRGLIISTFGVFCREPTRTGNE